MAGHVCLNSHIHSVQTQTHTHTHIHTHSGLSCCGQQKEKHCQDIEGLPAGDRHLLVLIREQDGERDWLFQLDLDILCSLTAPLTWLHMYTGAPGQQEDRLTLMH